MALAKIEYLAASTQTWEAAAPATRPSDLSADARREIILARGDLVADQVFIGVRQGLEYSARSALAPVSCSPFAHLAAALPTPVPGAPAREAAVISLAINGVSIDQETPLDDLLRFREEHRALLGRLRASLVDLSAQINPDKGATAISNEAEAVIRNRVEPALGDLDLALRASKIAFVWRSIVGVAGVTASGAPAPQGLGRSAQVLAQAIHYAFDRDALIREHPFGYLHMVRTSFGDRSLGASRHWNRAIDDPQRELRELFREMYSSAFEAVPFDDPWVLSTVGVPPVANQRFTEDEARVLRTVIAEARSGAATSE